MDVIVAIRARRSIRKYKPEPVNEKDLNVVLEAARLAPSWANTQCWKFIVVRDPDIKAKIASTLNKDNPAIVAILEAPVLIVACAELGKSGYEKGVLATDKGEWFMFDVALAMENLVLAACSLGLGTVHVGLFDSSQAGEFLGLPEGIICIEMTPLGYPAQERNPRPRKELSEIVYYNKYGQG